MKWTIGFLFVFAVLLPPKLVFSESDGPGIQWKEFKGVGPFKKDVLKSIQPEALASMANRPINWNDYSSKFWNKADVLRNSKQNTFQASLSQYMTLMLAGKDIDKNYATYDALFESLKSLEESKKAMQRSFLQNLREIDFPILVKNSAVMDFYGGGSQSDFIRQIENRIDDYIETENVQEKIVGSWLQSRKTMVDGKVSEDIIVERAGFRLEQFPSDPIVKPSEVPGKKNERRFTIYKALRIYPNFTLGKDSLYEVTKTKSNDCPDCEIVSVDFKGADHLKGPNDREKLSLIADVRRHASIQDERLAKIRKAHQAQMTDLHTQMTGYRQQMQAIKAEVESLANKVLPEGKLDKSLFKNWDKYEEVFQYLASAISDIRKGAEDDLNNLFNTSEKIVYTLKRVAMSEHDQIMPFFWERMSPNERNSDFNMLMERIKELQKIEVTTVKNGIPTSVQGSEFYVDPTLNSVKEYALIGPVMLIGEEKLVSRSLTYLLALKAELKKATCPVGGQRGGVFKKTKYRSALDTCRPCQLPTLDELVRNSNLLDGEYWSRETEDAAIKVFVKGKDKCDSYENNPMLSDNFTRFDVNTGVILRSKSSRARFLCSDSVQ